MFDTLAKKTLTHLADSTAYIPDVVLCRAQIEPRFKFEAVRGLGYVVAVYDPEVSEYIGFVCSTRLGFENAKALIAAQENK